MPSNDNEYREFLESLEPFSIGLNSSSTPIDRRLHWQIRKKKLRPVSDIASRYQVDWVGKEGFDVVAALRVTAKHPDTEARIFEVNCEFEVHFHGHPMKREHVARFAQGELRVFVWPYFRQFVADITSRMGVAPLMIPISISEKDDGEVRKGRRAKAISSSAPGLPAAQ
jgi:hypothetical protein